MRWNSFAKSLLFAAIAALALVPVVWVLAPHFGYAPVASGYILFVVSTYVMGLAPDWKRGARVFLLASAFGLAVWLVASSVPQAALGATLVLALCRSGFLYRRRLSGALVTEIAIGAGALAAATLAAGSTTLSLALALWAFMLVQSAFFLVAPAPRHMSRASRDAFEAAAERATELMDRI